MKGGNGKGAKQAIQASVYPALVPNEHVLASVNHVFNAVFVRGDVVGDTLFYGRGAGKDATASAVLSDISRMPRSITNTKRATAFRPLCRMTAMAGFCPLMKWFPGIICG